MLLVLSFYHLSFSSSRRHFGWIWFANIFCLIDDLAEISDVGEFEGSYKDMFSPELELKKESNNTEEGSVCNFK